MAETDNAPRVLCLRPEKDFTEVGVAAPAGLAVTYVADEKAISEIGPDVTALVLPSAGAALAPELFAEAKNLRLVQYTGAGTDRIARELLPSGCAIANVPGASAPDVAAYVVLVTGTLLRRLLVADERVKFGEYGEARRECAPARVRGFRGLRVGIVGYGDIGIHTGRLFEALGAEISFFDPKPPARPEVERTARRDLDELCSWAEVLTVHVPLLESTRGLIGAEQLKLLPSDAVVVNAARGGIVDEAALIAALDAGEIGGAALDVYTSEPLPADAPLLAAAARHPHRMILTPHIGGVTAEASRVLFSTAWQNVAHVLVEGGASANRVN